LLRWQRLVSLELLRLLGSRLLDRLLVLCLLLPLEQLGQTSQHLLKLGRGQSTLILSCILDLPAKLIIRLILLLRRLAHWLLLIQLLLLQLLRRLCLLCSLLVHGRGRELFVRLRGYHLPGGLQLDLLKQLYHLGGNLLLGVLIDSSRVLTVVGGRLLIKCAGGTTGRRTSAGALITLKHLVLLLLLEGLRGLGRVVEALRERCLLVGRRLLLRWLRLLLTLFCGGHRRKLLLDAWLRCLGLLGRVLLHNL
jgi:hypothetical protein